MSNGWSAFWEARREWLEKWSALGAVTFAIVNLIISVSLWCVALDNIQITKEMFAAAYRPYVWTYAPRTESTQNTCMIGYLMRNDGTAPAIVIYKEHLFVNGLPVQLREPSPGTPSYHYIAPHESIQNIVEAANESCSQLFQPTNNIELVIDARYHGTTKEQQCYHADRRYEPRFNAWRMVKMSITCNATSRKHSQSNE